MSTVLIRQIPDDYADSTGLAKYNRSRMPGCKDTFVASDSFDGSYVTGLSPEKAKAYQEILGKDFGPNSSFWQDFKVEIYADKPKVFETSKPLEDIALSLLIANGYVAPTKEEAYTPQYREAQYYAYTEESEDKEEISSSKKRDRAKAKLLSIDGNEEKMVLYGSYLEGIKYSSKLKADTLYKMLRAYIDDKEIKNAENFLELFERPIEELQQKVLVDKALKQRLITEVRIGKKQKSYQYGQVTIGSTLEEVYKNLSLPDFAPELMSIKSELEKDRT